MNQKIDCLGQKFNNLTVIREINPYFVGKKKRIGWLCRCNCGNEIITTLGNLRANYTKSCGCIKYNYFILTDSTRDFLDGLLIGDGSYAFASHTSKKSVKLIMSQISLHRDWMEHIKIRLEKENIKSKIYEYPPYTRVYNNRTINAKEQCPLHSLSYVTLINEKLRWYPEGIKIVPKDINLSSSELLANWYMGDGNLTSRKRIELHTNSFTENDVNWLRTEFYKKLNIVATIINRYKKYFTLSIGQKDSAHVFFEKIRPFILNSFLYKLP